MHLSISFLSALFVFVTLYSHSRIISDAKTIAAPKTISKSDSTKITSRSTRGVGQVFTISTDAEGRPSQTCQCVIYYLCDTQDVYFPSQSESHITCDSQHACCTRPQLSDEPQNTSTNSNNSTDICVAASQCDQNKLADTYGLGVLIERSVFSECPIGKVKCPADKVLPNVIGVNPPSVVAPATAEDCSCTPPVYCKADFGENVLREKIFQCDSAEVCCPKDLIQTVLDTPTPVQPPTTNTECGIRKEVIYSKLSGSAETISGEFPWMILILERVNNEEKVKCGASLVSSNLVLTAAHCIANKTMSSFIVRAGEYNLNTPSTSEEFPHQDREIKNITIHYGFYRKLLLHDLALIEINEPFQYSTNVAPICLPLMKSPYSPEDTSIYDLNRCVATGWGSKESGDPTVRNILGKIDMKIIPSDQCVNMLRKSALGSKFFLHESLICAMGKPGIDTCKGDGGGPLICPLRGNLNKYVQVGVIAGGLACTSPFPSLFASLLLNNSAWITEEILFKNTFPA